MKGDFFCLLQASHKRVIQPRIRFIKPLSAYFYAEQLE